MNYRDIYYETLVNEERAMQADVEYQRAVEHGLISSAVKGLARELIKQDLVVVDKEYDIQRQATRHRFRVKVAEPAS